MYLAVCSRNFQADEKDAEGELFLNGSKKRWEVFFGSFCATLLLAAAFAGFLYVDYTLLSADYTGGDLAQGALSLWKRVLDWMEFLWWTVETAGDFWGRALGKLGNTFGNLLHYANFMI